MKIKTLIFGAIVALSATFNASAMDDGCNQEERDPNSSVKKYTYVTPTGYNYQFDFWWLHCGNSEQLLFKTYLKTGIEDKTNGTVTDYAKISQNGTEIVKMELSKANTLLNEAQYKSAIYYDNQITTDKHIEVCITTGDEADYMCKNIFSASSSGIFTVTGTWYDPAYDGSGFNVVETSSGLFIYFYGYKASADGQPLWLVSAVGPKTLTKGQSFSMTLYTPTLGNGANFITKPTNGSGVSEWGTATLTFNSCTSGTITLNGQDGTLTHNVVKLANINNLTCSE